ncbi:MAG: MipA/OmpV family protein [Pseudomonadota bacterium]
MKFRHLVFIGSLLTATPTMAADIAREIHSPSAGSSAFAELGIVLGSGKLPLIGFNGQSREDSGDPIHNLSIGLTGRLEFNRFFAEFIENSFSNATIGAKAWTGDNAEVELIITSLFDQISRRNEEGFETIDTRKSDLNAGLRSSYFFGDGIMQFELVHDIIDSHNGFTGSIQFGHQALARNWNLHVLAGVRYFSKDVIDHLFGVSASESTDTLPAYRAKHGFMPTIQVGAALPLSERWVFRAVAEYSRLPDAVTDSPLAQGSDIYNVQGGVYYVFGGR